MSKIKKVTIIVLSTLFVASMIGNYKLSRMKVKNEKLIKQLQASIQEKSKEISEKTTQVGSLIAEIQTQASEIVTLKNFKPEIRYIKVKDKDVLIFSLPFGGG